MYPETLTFCEGVKVVHLSDLASELHIDNKRTKRYNGETAWMDAERDAYDLSIERMYH